MRTYIRGEAESLSISIRATFCLTFRTVRDKINLADFTSLGVIRVEGSYNRAIQTFVFYI